VVLEFENLGVGTLQLHQILLEGFHFLRSTPSKSKNEECEGDVLLSSVVAQRNFLKILAIESEQCEIGSDVAYFQLYGRSRLFLAVFFASGFALRLKADERGR
jgi:hypothetical protein